MTLNDLSKKLEAAPAKLRKSLGSEVKKLEAVPAKVRKTLGTEVHKLEVAPTKLKKQLDVELKKLDRARARLFKQLEALPTKAVEAFGIARASQLKTLRSEMAKLSKRVDALNKA